MRVVANAVAASLLGVVVLGSSFDGGLRHAPWPQLSLGCSAIAVWSLGRGKDRMKPYGTILVSLLACLSAAMWIAAIL